MEGRVGLVVVEGLEAAEEDGIVAEAVATVVMIGL